MRTPPGALVVLLLAACSSGRDADASRATLRPVGPAQVEILPAEHQPPFCLAFTVSERGVVRQLTMTPQNESIPCPAGEPVGGTSYRMPPAEGKVRIHLVFSDRALDATPIGLQVHELAHSPGFSAMDLRAPGQVRLATLEFEPH
jgi:hypothetical protein